LCKVGLGNSLELCLSGIVSAFTIAVAKQRARYRLQQLGNLTAGIATIALAVSQRVRLVLRIRRSSNLAKISRWQGALGG
jgi:3-hydroxy-3-methylglutaryl CoA synthase